MVVMWSASDGSDGYGAVGNGVDGDAVVPEELHAEEGFGVQLQDLCRSPGSSPNDRGFGVRYSHKVSGSRSDIDPIHNWQAQSNHISVW
jgi:hypothetical protein